jgi:Ran GTPase-activating protein (RanGAP) involved in mRNA processing and transport
MALELQFGNENSFDAPSQVQVFGSTQASDGISLAGALQSMPNLCCLSLTNSLMNDDLIRVFINELKAKETDEDSCSIRDTLVELNLSYNKLTTEGFRLVLLYFFDGDNRHAVNDYHSSNDHDQDQDHERTSASILSTLKVAGNKIRAEGARTLGRILKYNTSLENLDLRMNLLNDEGGKLVMNGLHQNQTLKRLNLSCNSLSSMTSDSLCAIFETSNCRPNGIASLSCSDPPQGNVLEHIDISSNDFKSSDIINLAHAVEQTYTLLSLDLRENRADTETSKTSIVHKVTKTEALESIHDKLKSNASRSAGPQSVPQSEMQ